MVLRNDKRNEKMQRLGFEPMLSLEQQFFGSCQVKFEQISHFLLYSNPFWTDYITNVCHFLEVQYL